MEKTYKGFKTIKELGTIKKNKIESIKIRKSVNLYTDKIYYDIRIMIENEDGSGILTKKGISVSEDTLKELIEILAKELKNGVDN